MPRGNLELKVSSVSLEERHFLALDRYAEEYRYAGRSAALRRILDLSPELQRCLTEQEEPTPCPTPP